MKIFSKKITTITLIIVFFFSAFHSVLAYDPLDMLNAVGQDSGYYDQNNPNPGGIPGLFKSAVSQIIATVLGFLGLLFLVLIIVSGIQWMTAGGNEESVTKAKKRLVNAVIGLAIIFVAFIITVFVITTLNNATGGNNGGGIQTQG
jgi:hypothetical protein